MREEAEAAVSTLLKGAGSGTIGASGDDGGQGSESAASDVARPSSEMLVENMKSPSRQAQSNTGSGDSPAPETLFEDTTEEE